MQQLEVPRARLAAAWGVYEAVHLSTLARKTQDQYRGCYAAALRDLPDPLTPAAVVRWHRQELLGRRKLSPGHANAHLHVLRTVARRAGLITGDQELCSVVWQAVPVRMPVRAPRCPPPDLMQRALPHARNPAEAAWLMLAGYAGLRRGELLGLRPGDYCPELHTLQVVRQRLSEHRKNRRPHVVRIDCPELQQALAWTIANNDRARARNGNFRGSSDGYLFPWSLRYTDRFLARLRRNLGPRYFKKGWGWHAFRHWGATGLARLGASPVEIQAWLGDSSPSIAMSYVAQVRGLTSASVAALATHAQRKSDERPPPRRQA